MNEKGFTLWFTGLHGSGKTTLARMAEKEIRNRGLKVEVLDGGAIRNSLSKGLGFSKDDRDTHIRRMGFVCNLLTRNGVVAIVSAISPYRAVRDENRKQIGSFVEVYVKCPVEICRERDVKGLYKKAVDGEIRNFTGVSDSYEEPLNPEVKVETDKESPDRSLAKILSKLEKLNYMPPKGEDAEDTCPDEEVYSIEDEDKIKKRLEDLGYI
ncbi:MAG: adenylyl-sulfate kinase [bacterium]